ncbi:MAG TPA: histidine kinase N-terminal domain-containing protein [Armatimonadota bacterium]|nr:histidine kinase N-terminal domain-containing protein [Armatimonadota bacterium]
MALQSVRDLCEIAADVGIEDVATLTNVGAHLDLLADIVGGDIALLAQAHEPGQSVVLAEGRPAGRRTLYGKSRLGELIPHETAPLVARCLTTRKLQRSRHATLLGGRPVEQAVLPVFDPQGLAIGACSIERSLLDGERKGARRALKGAAAALSGTLANGALQPGDLLHVLRMARGLAIINPGGEILYADAEARRAWEKAQSGEPLQHRLPAGVPGEATALSRATQPWGDECEFEVDGVIFRRQDILLEPGRLEGNTLTTIRDVTHLHAGQWLVSGRTAEFQEIHHRIKNNLQTISSLLRMQARREESPQAQASLQTAIGRVQSVAFVHEALSLDGTDRVDIKALAETLIEAAVHGPQRAEIAITTAVLGPRLLVPANRASQIALVLNELIQNAVKHAFPEGQAGSLTARIDASEDEVLIAVEDDGVGLPEGFDLRKTSSLGLQIAQRIVASDLGGTLEMHGDGGTVSVMRLPSELADWGTQDQ